MVVSNNPLVWEHAGEACHRVTGSSLNVLYACLTMVGARGFSLHTHPVAGNARLMHNPYRTVFLKEKTPTAEHMLRDLRCLEVFIGVMENLGGEAPLSTFDDYRTVDYGLYLGMLPADTSWRGSVPEGVRPPQERIA